MNVGHRSGLGFACAIAVLVIWSSFILIGRLNATGAHTLLPLDIAFLRFVFSGLGVLVIAAVRVRRAPAGRPARTAAFGPLTVGQIAALGAFAGVGYCSLAYTGFFFAPAAHASVLMTGSLPFWTTVIVFFVLREPITRASLVAVLLIIAGGALVGQSSFRTALDGGDAWKGDLCFLGASMMWAAYTVSCRKWRVGPMDATVAIGVSCLVTFVPVYALGAAAGWWPSHLFQAGWREIAFQITFQAGFAMLIAGPAFTQVIASFGALRAAMLTALVPVISALAAVPLLHEPLGILPIAGLVAVTAGFGVSVFASRESVQLAGRAARVPSRVVRRSSLLVALAALGGSLVAADDRALVADRVLALTRESAWTGVARVPLAFGAFHPQGMVKIGDTFFVSAVEVTTPTVRYPTPRGGYDRDAGRGVGHLFKIDRDGRLLADLTLTTGDAYHPGGIDYDGRFIWVPLAEYRPNSSSVIYKVDPTTMTATEVFRFPDSIGAIVHNTDDNTLHGVNWGSRRFYRWTMDRTGRVTNAGAPPDRLGRANPSHYVDYQDCKYLARRRMLCAGLADLRQSGSPVLRLGGLDLVSLDDGRPLHQVPVPLWTAGGAPMTRNPFWVEPNGASLRVWFLPEDDNATLYVYDVK